ncbi:5-deoxy-glucuronate isomerase, partial [Neptunomonas phycophila]|uniref:5-deoxy-glucuronate isomerase n=1 Tax=Neptunomonas phycophila TaxID=1572645 RepID=UPI00351995D6
MHIAPYENKNIPIVDVDHDLVPLNYFNIVKLSKGENFIYRLNHYETCIVPATGTINIDVDGQHFNSVGNRSIDVWGGEPEGVYAPTNTKACFECITDTAEIFIAGAKYEKVLEPFAVRPKDIDLVQYGSDETKTHRKIKHILGANQR